MLQALEEWQGHSPEAAYKGGQLVVVETVCPYADGRLLPALSATGRFIDPEIN